MDVVNRANILVVDDEPEIRAYFSRLISDLGAIPLEAKDGVHALEAVRAVIPDLILLDVEMPRMDGFSVCRKLKADPHTARIPVVLITSLTSLEDRVEGLEAGADDFLNKPVYVPEFNARVKSLLRIKKLNDSLDSAEDVIFTLARAVEAKDSYTQGHTERVTSYALRLGAAVGVSEKELISLRHGGTLHDIGKIAIPDHILNKPARLSLEELEIVKKHPAVGYNIVSPLRSLADALPCIRWHHEKPNGTGYPDAIKGAAIPKVALILAVADVYDALTSKRPYKEELSVSRSCEILLDEAKKGGLDLDLVNIFISKVLV